MNVAKQLDRALNNETHALVRRAAALADVRALPIYVVGGTVRDLLREQMPGDLDLVVEGDAIGLAEALAAALDGTLTAHAAFGTAVLTLPGGATLDMITARRETYATPAALPDVTPSNLRDDLFRRDFTINTLAVQLNAAQYGELFDLYGGLDDLQRGVVRVLHDQSFVDDPTRILRAVRMAARLGFDIEPHTCALLAAALTAELIERTTPQRIANELRLVLHEPLPERAIALLDELGALPHLLPELRWNAVQTSWFRAARQAAFPQVALSQLYLALAVYPLPNVARSAIIGRYRPNAAIARMLGDITLAQSQVPLLRGTNVPHSAIDQALHGIHDAALRAAQIAEGAPVSTHIELYLGTLRDTQIALNGRDLQRMGFKPGPLFRQLLNNLRAAKLDGLLRTRADEEVWVQRNAQQRDEGHI